jgi:YD repeat-containing protein
MKSAALILALLASIPAIAFGEDARIYTKDGKYVGKVKESGTKTREIYDSHGNLKGKVRSYGDGREKIVFDKYGNRIGTIRK